MRAKSDLPIINSVCEKFWFTISSRLSKMIFFNFCFFFFFTFPNFNWLLPKILRKNHLFYNGFRRFFDNKTTALLTFFEISAEMHYASLFFLNERNITTSLLMIYLKCTVLHYADLNLSYINKPYLQAVEYAILFFCFFRFLIYGYFKEAFAKKNFKKKLSFCNTNFQNLFQDLVYYRI